MGSLDKMQHVLEVKIHQNPVGRNGLKQQTARKAVSKRLGRRFKNCEGKGIFLKNGLFWKMLS